ncbi:MAG: hypothetical protein JO256_13530, partial [Alphaproteobacteria bacterium]|nr:hypothetical protein [Alphaproteobacteria bacterium]
MLDELQKGLRLKAEGRLDSALEAFSRASAIAPFPLEAFLEAGVTAAQLNRVADAARWFHAGIEAWPQRYEAYYFEGI